jgi:hypothetical protein
VTAAGKRDREGRVGGRWLSSRVPGGTCAIDGPGETGKRARARFPARAYSFGKITVSITWITPFEASTSVFVTFAPATVTPFAVSIATLWPWTVSAESSFTTSAARTLPATTW